MLLTAFSALLVTAACSQNEPQVVTVPTVVENKIPVQARPRPVSMRDVEFFVVTEDNYEQFVERFVEENGRLVFIAISVDDYENLALNLADLRRFIEQQREVIVFYENAVR